LSEFALPSSGKETFGLNGQVSERKKLLADNVASTDAEQFSAIFDMRMFSKAVFQAINSGGYPVKYTFYGAIDPNIKWDPLPNGQNQVLPANSSQLQALSDSYAFKVSFQKKRCSPRKPYRNGNYQNPLLEQFCSNNNLKLEEQNGYWLISKPFA
jgi:hypothetical protein